MRSSSRCSPMSGGAGTGRGKRRAECSTVMNAMQPARHRNASTPTPMLCAPRAMDAKKAERISKVIAPTACEVRQRIRRSPLRTVPIASPPAEWCCVEWSRFIAAWLIAHHRASRSRRCWSSMTRCWRSCSAFAGLPTGCLPRAAPFGGGATFRAVPARDLAPPFAPPLAPLFAPPLAPPLDAPLPPPFDAALGAGRGGCLAGIADTSSTTGKPGFTVNATCPRRSAQHRLG